MAEDKIEGREATWRQLLPWTELFRGFQVAFDFNKMLLAAAGILVMAFGWWLLAVVFRNMPRDFTDVPPDWPAKYRVQEEPLKAWEQFKRDRDEWNLLHETAGLGKPGQTVQVLDLASSPQEYESLKELDAPDTNVPQTIATLEREGKLSEAKGRIYLNRLGKPKPFARLATWPWWEDRGPNPYLLVTGQAGIPWEAGHFWDWFLRDQLLVMIEPLVKFVQPIIYFFSPRSTNYTSIYFFFVMLWTLATWALFGGAITRIAAVQATRGEKIGLREALRFTLKRFLSYLMAPLFPLAVVLVVLIFMVLFGVFHMIPVLGDVFLDGLLWWLMLICGLVMAVTLVGLVGWPLMSATISTEGTDSWEAVSRSYSYVFQRPWNYVWYSLVAIAYGAVLVFFVGLMGSLTVYLAKWGVSETPFIRTSHWDRDPTFLFAYAPTSFGWRNLLLQDATVHGQKVVDNGEINQAAWEDYVGRTDYQGEDKLNGVNKVGAFLVSIWLSLVFLLMLGFGYSYFWSASTIIYLLMRRHVDAAELDEVYLEEDEQEGPYGGQFIPPAPPPSPAVKPTPMTMVEPPTPAVKGPSPMAMVEPPSLRTPPPAPPPPPQPVATVLPPEPAPAPKPTVTPPPEDEGGESET
ncbi:MAG TPA: hypothetical protein VMF69_22655 [Gemmataceae bacterium]|nr:hypothetical protein [Gemmataceae bacterium]